MTDEREDQLDPRSEPARKCGEYPYFTARPVEVIDNGPAWKSYVIGVFEHQAGGSVTQIGTYQRNYAFLRTFWWFRRESRHFALYSRDYTATRVMEIVPGEGIRDLGGEEPTSGGFCPVEFYVPDGREQVSQEWSGAGERIADWDAPLASLPLGCEFTKDQGTHRGRALLRGADGLRLKPEKGTQVWGEERDYESGWIKHPPNHGFVAGCIWGDNSSWKIQYLDLSRVEDGIIKRDERFGYIELPQSVRLRDAIHVWGLLKTPRVDIAISATWELETGKMKPLQVPPWDEE